MELGLTDSKSVKTPRLKPDLETHLQAENSKTLERQAATRCTLRAAHLAQDRVDVSESVKCLSRHMQAPLEGHTVELKRLARSLLGNRCCALVFSRQSTKGAHLQVHADSDWAGDSESRRSTMRMTIGRGKRVVRHMSMEQTCIGLSSPESELYGITRGQWARRATLQTGWCRQRYSVLWFISGTRGDAAEWTWREVETCSDTTPVVAGIRSHEARSAEMRCWNCQSSRRAHEGAHQKTTAMLV